MQERQGKGKARPELDCCPLKLLSNEKESHTSSYKIILLYTIQLTVFPNLHEQSQQCIIIYCILLGPGKANWKHYMLRYNDTPLAFITFRRRGFPNYLLKHLCFFLKSSIFPAGLVFCCSSVEFGSLSHIFHFYCYGNLVQQYC